MFVIFILFRFPISLYFQFLVSFIFQRQIFLLCYFSIFRFNFDFPRYLQFRIFKFLLVSNPTFPFTSNMYFYFLSFSKFNRCFYFELHFHFHFRIIGYIPILNFKVHCISDVQCSFYFLCFKHPFNSEFNFSIQTRLLSFMLCSNHNVPFHFMFYFFIRLVFYFPLISVCIIPFGFDLSFVF